MAFAFNLLSVAGFTGLMAAAAVEDFRRLVIPNTIVAGLCVLWPLHLAMSPSFSLGNSLGAVGCAAAVFLVGALLYSRGLIGGGDVKLLAAATLWAGPASIPALLIVTAVLGGLLTLVLLLSAPLRAAVSWAGAVAPASSMPVPYGVAIAAAAVIVTLPPNLS